jgi:DHA1 family bicyclomycin/chloramphenicol resistance-like MFS transporter
MTATTQTPDRAARTRRFLILGGLAAFGPLSIDMYLPALPQLGVDLGAPAAAVQLTLTACLVGLAVGQLVAGPLSDRLGRRRPLLVGISAYVVASLLCATAPSVPVLAGLRFVQGLAGAAGIVISRAVVRDLYTGAAAVRFFSLLMLVTGTAPILAPVIGGQVLELTSWRGIFVLLSVIGSAILVAVGLGLRETLPEERRRDDGPLEVATTMRLVLADRRFLGYALASGLAFGGLFAYVSGSPFVLQGIYGASPQTFSAIFAVNSVGLVVASQINGRLAGRVDAHAILRGAIAAMALAGLTLLLVVEAGLGIVAVLPPLFAMVASIGIVMPTSTALALRDHAAVAGSASALVGVVQFLLGAAVAPLPGIAGEGTALPMAAVMFALPVAALVCLSRLTSR